MNLRLGSQVFRDVTIPVLWGTRAIVQDPSERISVIDLGRAKAKLEVLANEPAPDIQYRPTEEGFTVLDGDLELYTFNPSSRTLTSQGLGLPEIEFTRGHTRVGSNIFGSNMVIGSPVGLRIDQAGIAMGAPLPPGLAALVV